MFYITSNNIYSAYNYHNGKLLLLMMGCQISELSHVWRSFHYSWFTHNILQWALYLFYWSSAEHFSCSYV